MTKEELYKVTDILNDVLSNYLRGSEAEEVIAKLEESVEDSELIKEEPQVKESAEIQHVNETCKENSDSLTQEEDLKEAAKHYLYSNILYDDVYVGNPTDKDCIEMFKAGANWQKSKDAKLIINAKDDGYRLGLATMKQQMLANAVDGDITFDYYGDDDKTYGCIAHDSFCLEDFGLKDMDKVKVIVIKEE